MNVIKALTLTHINSNRTLDFLNESSIRVVDDLTNNFNTSDSKFPVENGMVYSDSKVMNETIMNISTQVDINNDIYVKNLLNYQGDTYKLMAQVNGNTYVCFGKIGNQQAQVNAWAYKVYTFDFRMITRWFKSYEINVQEGIVNNITPSDPGVYDTAKYDTDQYDNIGVTVKGSSATFNNLDNEIIYLDISGTVMDIGDVVISVNNTDYEYNNGGIGNEFRLINIPSMLGIYNNGVMEGNLLKVSSKTSFNFNLTQSYNIVNIQNLTNVKITAYEVVLII